MGIGSTALRIGFARCAPLAAALAVAVGAAETAWTQAPPAASKPPNIVLIVADDAALMDFGAYGGEAHTPHIDALAARGALFTNYHTSPLCSPSRAMLLTGLDNHQAGVATIEEVLPKELADKPGYSLRLEPGVLTLADRLRAEGYHTLMAGKWHLGDGPGDLPNAHGFDRSIALDASGADNWAPKAYMPYYKSAPWFEDGKPARLPKDLYSSTYLVDRLIGFIEESEPSRPFFAYLAFQAVHIPVQAPKERSDNYAGRFNEGWSVLRQARFERARALGLAPPGASLAPLPSNLRDWQRLGHDEQRIYARSMEVYSGMLEAMDAEIGRLVGHIATRGDLDNTIFVVTSDNGPEPSDPVHAPGMNVWMPLNGYNWSIGNLGERGSLAFIGPEWAASISSPSSLYKFYASEGGLRAPLIIAGPGARPSLKPGGLAFVTDVAPTLLELSGAPPEKEGGKPITGKSLAPVLAGLEARTHAAGDPVGIEVSGNAALFRGDHKIVRNMPPVGDGQWRLYNLAQDPGETFDLANAEPALLADMVREYQAYEVRAGVLPLPPGYQVERQIMRNTIARQLSFNAWPLGILGGAIVLSLFALLRSVGRKRTRP